MPTYDAALNWNREHPIGSRVTVTLANGETSEDQTASGAVQWGSIALVTLKDRPGMWMTSMLTVLPPSPQPSRPMLSTESANMRSRHEPRT